MLIFRIDEIQKVPVLLNEVHRISMDKVERVVQGIKVLHWQTLSAFMEGGNIKVTNS